MVSFIGTTVEQWVNREVGSLLLIWRPTPQRVLLFVASLCLLLLAVCALPYAVPPKVFVKGASYEVGFNNSLAYLSYLVVLWLPVLALVSMLSVAVLRRQSAYIARLGESAGPIFPVVVVAHAVLFIFLYLYKGQFVFGEALYFQTLLYRMTLGELPYLDFNFYYGPAMLYPGYLLTHVLSVEAAYGVYFILTYLAGLSMLHRLLRLLLSDRKSVDRWFMLLALGFFNPWTGINVTFVRYLLPVTAFLAAAVYFRGGGGWAAVRAVCWLALAALYTFEAGAVALVSTAVLVVAMLLRSWISRLLQRLPLDDGVGRSLSEETSGDRELTARLAVTPSRLLGRFGVLIGVAGLICVGSFFAVDPSGEALRLYPEIALSYSAGAHNMPIYPSLPVLTLIGITVGTVAVLLRVTRLGGGSRQTDLAVAGLALVLLMQRGAFGVTETTHIAYYGLPVFLLCLTLLRILATARRMETVLAWSLVLGVAVPLQYYHASLFVPFVSARWGAARAASGTVQAVSVSGPVQETLTTLVKRLGTQKPYLMLYLDYYSFPIYRRMGLRYATAFTMVMNARTHEDIELLIRQLRTSKPVILVRKETLEVDGPAQEPARKERLLGFLSGSHPAGSSLENLIAQSERRTARPLIEFIRSEYRIVSELNGIVALLPRTERASSQVQPAGLTP